MSSACLGISGRDAGHGRASPRPNLFYGSNSTPLPSICPGTFDPRVVEGFNAACYTFFLTFPFLSSFSYERASLSTRENSRPSTVAGSTGRNGQKVSSLPSWPSFLSFRFERDSSGRSGKETKKKESTIYRAALGKPIVRRTS